MDKFEELAITECTLDGFLVKKGVLTSSLTAKLVLFLTEYWLYFHVRNVISSKT